jgi:YVTN family beta-propeller protein
LTKDSVMAGRCVVRGILVVLLGGSVGVEAAPRGFVTNSQSGTVSVVDTASGAVMDTVVVGAGPVGVAVNRAGTRAYVANSGAGTVSVVDTATNAVLATVPVASLPVGVAVNPAGTAVYVTNFASSLVSVIDPATDTLAGSIAVGNGPSGLAVHPSGAVLYVANSLSNTVSVIDTALGTVVTTIPVGSQPEGLALDPSGAFLYVADNGDGTLSIIDTGLGTVSATVTVGGLPSGVAVHPDGSRVYVRNLSGSVSVVSAATHAVVATIPVGGATVPLNFQGLALEPGGTRLYVARPDVNAVAVVDVATNTVTGSVAVGEAPLAFGAFVGPCAAADDCSDGNPCTDDACDVATGRCTHTGNSAPCDDGNACTTGDTCLEGACRAGGPVDCSDGNPCTTDACDPATGACTHANNTASCDDGNACTTGDVCQGGTCTGGPAPSCNDGNPCTDDACNPATGCVHTSNTVPCDDGNACTTGDACQGGACTGGPAPSCNDGNPCTDDACNPATGCVHTSNTAPCNDGNACTTGDACQGGTCTGGPAPSCNDGNPCTDDACNPATGCVHTNNTAPCNDGNVCTTGDVCQGGTCTGTALGCDDANPCTDDLCDSSLGCLHANNNLPCNDANTCTAGDVCNGGVCVGGNVATGCTACQAVAGIPAQGGVFVGTTSGAGSLGATCAVSNNSGERVYRWVPSTSGTATIFTCGTGTDFDTIVYLRSTCGAAGDLACNDDTSGCGVADGSPNAGFHGSRITPTVTAGQPYFIVVDGWNGKLGTYALTVVPPTVCGNNVREGAEQCDGTDVASCASGACDAQCRCVVTPTGFPDLVPEISQVSVERNATVASGDVAEGCAESTSGVDLLRFTVKTRNQGTADFVLGNPGCPAPCTSFPLAVCANPSFICSPAAGHNHPHYNNYARYDLLDASGQSVVVGHKQGFCLLDDGACPNPHYACDNQGLTAGCSDTYSATLGCQYLDITSLPAGSYNLRVTVDPFGRIGELDETNNVVTVPVTIPVATTTSTTTLPATTSTTSTTVPGGTTTTTTTLPPGGACASPTVVPAAGGVFNGTTAGASTLAGTCAQSDNSPEKVFQWTPSVSGTASIFTCSPSGTNFDTIVYVRQATCGGTQIACNDDTAGCGTGDGAANAGQHASRVTPTVTAGQTYFIVVDGWNGRSGNFQLTITPPTPPASTTTSTTLPTTTSTSVPTTSTTTVTSTSSTSVTSSSSTTVTSTTSTSSTVLGQCSAPTVIPAAGGVFTGVTSGASTLAGTCATTNNSPEQVFQWTPTRSGVATIETCSATQTLYDTVLYLRQTPCSTGTQLACNDDLSGCATGDGTANAGFHGSRVTPTVAAGQTYFIVVDGYNGKGGAFRLNVIPPP